MRAGSPDLVPISAFKDDFTIARELATVRAKVDTYGDTLSDTYKDTKKRQKTVFGDGSLKGDISSDTLTPIRTHARRKVKRGEKKTLKSCLNCGKKFKGISRKKHCNDNCRKAYSKNKNK